MPADDRLRPENCKRAEDGREPTIEPNEQKAIGIAELWSLRYLSAKHVELLAKDQDFCHELRSRLKKRGYDMENQSEKLDHQVAGLPSLCLASSRIQFSVHTGRFDTCRRSTLSCWRRTRISATSFVLRLKNEAMIWRISRTNSIIKWQGYRVSASRLAESNFRYTQPFHHGIRRRGGTIFWATLPSI